MRHTTKIRCGCVMALVLLLPVRHVHASEDTPLTIYAINGYPLSFSHNGKPDGMTVELARAVQGCTGKSEDIEIVPWLRASEVASKKPNILMFPTVATVERSRYLDFVGPILNVHIAAYAIRSRAEELISDDPGLRNLRAGGRRGSVFVSQAKAAGYNFVDETNSSEGAIRMLMNGRFDLWFESEEIAKNAVVAAGYEMNDLTIMIRFPPQLAYFAFSKGTPVMVIEAWDHCLQKLKADGTFRRIHRKWLPDHDLPSESLSPGKVKPNIR